MMSKDQCVKEIRAYAAQLLKNEKDNELKRGASSKIDGKSSLPQPESSKNNS